MILTRNTFKHFLKRNVSKSTSAEGSRDLKMLILKISYVPVIGLHVNDLSV